MKDGYTSNGLSRRKKLQVERVEDVIESQHGIPNCRIEEPLLFIEIYSHHPIFFGNRTINDRKVGGPLRQNEGVEDGCEDSKRKRSQGVVRRILYLNPNVDASIRTGRGRRYLNAQLSITTGKRESKSAVPFNLTVGIRKANWGEDL